MHYTKAVLMPQHKTVSNGNLSGAYHLITTIIRNEYHPYLNGSLYVTKALDSDAILDYSIQYLL